MPGIVIPPIRDIPQRGMVPKHTISIRSTETAIMSMIATSHFRLMRATCLSLLDPERHRGDLLSQLAGRHRVQFQQQLIPHQATIAIFMDPDADTHLHRAHIRCVHVQRFDGR
jgi:allophanate hydrolase subunit 1